MSDYKIVIGGLVIIVALIFFSSFLLYQNQSVKHKLTAKQKKYAELQQNLYKLQVGADLKSQQENDLEGKIVKSGTLAPICNSTNNYKIGKSRNRYTLLSFFSPRDCSSCLNSTLLQLNQLYVNRNDIDIVGIVVGSKLEQNSKELREIKILSKVPTFSDIPGEESIVKSLELTRGPVVVLMENATRKILYSFIFDSGDDKRLDEFIKKIERTCN